jgi:hypothetical protein
MTISMDPPRRGSATETGSEKVLVFRPYSCSKPALTRVTLPTSTGVVVSYSDITFGHPGIFFGAVLPPDPQKVNNSAGAGYWNLVGF